MRLVLFSLLGLLLSLLLCLILLLAPRAAVSASADQPAQDAVSRALVLSAQYHKSHGSFRGYQLIHTRLRPGGDLWKSSRLDALPTVDRAADPLRVYLHLGAGGRSVTACSIPNHGAGGFCASQTFQNGDLALYQQAKVRLGQQQVSLGEIAKVARHGGGNQRVVSSWGE